MMLSRVAARLYWLGRYLERAEDSARLIDAYGHLVLDIPKGLEPGWEALLATVASDEAFEQRYSRHTERNICKFLILDDTNAGSIRSSVTAARENVRTTRDKLPALAWELVNECYHYANDNTQLASSRSGRANYLEEIMMRLQQLNGLLESSLLRDEPFWFMRLGQRIERADMTTRILDVGAASILSRSGTAAPELPLLWAYLLTSLSAKSAFRRKVGPTLEADHVVNFLIGDDHFPRSVSYCINEVEELIGTLGAPQGMLRQVRLMARSINAFDAQAYTIDQLHEFIDVLQVDFGDLSSSFHDCWFALPERRADATATQRSAQ